MTLQTWFDTRRGRAIDVDGVPTGDPVQCVDLAKDYLINVIGIPAVARGNAVDYFDASYPPNTFIKIPNTPSAVPKGGDIMIWGSTSSPGWDGRSMGTYGHIAICSNEADVNHFVSLDQNWSIKAATLVNHPYTALKGWLRPLKDVNFDQAAYDAAVAAQREAERIAKEAEDARIAAEAAEAARKAQEEADRLAAEKAEADRIAKEEAEKEAEEQKRLAEEQAKLEAEFEARRAAEEKWYSFFINLIKFVKELIWKS